MWVFDARLAHFHRVGGGFSSIELMLCEADVEKLCVEMGRAGKSIKTLETEQIEFLLLFEASRDNDFNFIFCL